METHHSGLGACQAVQWDDGLRSFVRLSPRQLGFVEGNGNFANVRALHEAIRLGKKIQLCGVVLDGSRAFDCVPHEAIDRFLGARGVPGPLRAVSNTECTSTRQPLSGTAASSKSN